MIFFLLKAEFQRAVKVSSGFELDEKIVDVIFKVFDENNDGNLSYKEFIEVMKDRLKRNPKVTILLWNSLIFGCILIG